MVEFILYMYTYIHTHKEREKLLIYSTYIYMILLRLKVKCKNKNFYFISIKWEYLNQISGSKFYLCKIQAIFISYKQLIHKKMWQFIF